MTDGGDTELALRAAINVLRDTIETGRMPSGIELEPNARTVHKAAIAELERLLASVSNEYSVRPAACTGRR